MKNSVKRIVPSALFLLVISVAAAATTIPAPSSKDKSYDGVITQFNTYDGSFILRLRDGSVVMVKSPLDVGAFISVKGVMNAAGKVVEGVSALTTKDKNGSDAIPIITLLDPGSGQVCTKITLSGTGFTKKTNAISIGATQYAVMNVASSKDGKTLTFRLPPSPCNQKIKAVCAQVVLPAGSYDIVVTNENGVSSPVPFTVTPLPALTITTDILPQIIAGTRYKAVVEAIGGAEGYIWRVSDGRLSNGLMLAQSACTEIPCKTTALITGTPTTPGTSQFTVTLTSGLESISRQFSITVIQPLSSPTSY